MNSETRELIFLLILSVRCRRRIKLIKNVLPSFLCLHIIKDRVRILLISFIITGRKIPGDRYLTHSLHYPSSDPVLQRIIDNHLDNDQKSKVKIIFVPSYLNGNDGIFNMPYFDLLIGFDLSVFPSYYEPWGYTPLESLMFSIPTVTTSLSGFGLWVKNYFADHGNGISIIERTDDNEDTVVEEIRKFMTMFIGLNDAEIREAREKAHEVSRIAMWDSLVKYYFTAYEHGP